MPTKPKSVPRSIRFKTDTLRGLEQMAKKTDRSINYVVNRLCENAIRTVKAVTKFSDKP